MKKFFIFLILLQTHLFACASCVLMVPSVELEIDIKMHSKKLEKIHLKWHFSDIYTNEVTTQFDKNKNEKLDKEELENILTAMLQYLKPKKMLTSIRYADENATEPITLHPKYDNFKLEMLDEFLLFSYDATFYKELTPSSSLSLAFEDDESYFAFIMAELHINESDFFYTKNLYLYTASISFIEKMAFNEDVNKELNQTVLSKKQDFQQIDTEPIKENFLQKSMAKLKELFSSVKDEKNPLSYLLLLFFAYIYGVAHAMGPGHGKTLVASYFLANERSYSKALFISLAIGVVHTFSAFLLTLLIYFVLNTLLAQFLDDTIYYTTKISAFIIISIALTLLYKKYKLYESAKKLKQIPTLKFNTQPQHIETCGCHSCKVDNNSTDFALIVSAGIVPCPGTTTIFIFAISMGLYYAGFMSALVMSLGMSSVIFFSALLSTLLRTKLLTHSEKLKKQLEIASLTLILSLGVLLLFAS